MPDSEKHDIRPMRLEDIEQILRIEQASFSFPWRMEHFIHEIGAPYSFPFVSVADDSISGYICLKSIFETAEILDIAVAREFRNRGVARSLLLHAEERSRLLGAERVQLEVRVSNKAAVALYEKSGFIRTGIRKRYYEGVEDAILMEKAL